jgi:hypothetical protein
MPLTKFLRLARQAPHIYSWFAGIGQAVRVKSPWFVLKQRPEVAVVPRYMAMVGFLTASIIGTASAHQSTGSPADSIVVTGQQYNNKVVCRYE